jgi:hypothetical protein
MNPADMALLEYGSRRFAYAPFLNKLAEAYALNGRINHAARVMLTLQRLHGNIYPNFYDYWQEKSKVDASYRAVFVNMPARAVK